MTTDDLIGPDVGADLDLSKKAIVDWLIKYGKVAPKHAQLHSMFKQMARVDRSLEEYLALFIVVSHQSLHTHEAATSGRPGLRDAPRCKSKSCKTVALGKVLTEVYKCAADRAGCWARLANSLGPIVDVLEGLNLSELEKCANALQALQHAVPGQPEYDHYFSLLPTLDPAGLLAQVISRHSAFDGLQTLDADTIAHELATCSSTAAIYGALGLQVVGMLRDAIELGVKLRSQLRAMVPSHTLRTNQPGRPRHDWLNGCRGTLLDVSFTKGQVAEFLPNEVLKTDQQRRCATARIRNPRAGKKRVPKTKTTAVSRKS